MGNKHSAKKWRLANPEKQAASSRRWKLQNKVGVGLTVADYEATLKHQGGVCAICKSAETEKGNGGKVKRLAVDHCHSTGSIRGLLCAKCNHILGLCRDNKTVLQNAITYLETATTGFKIAVLPSAEDLMKELDSF